MKHVANARFWAAYRALPTEVQELADKAHALLVENPNHPSLRFKPVGSYWSARVGRTYRALAIRSDDATIWFWIGHHDEYERFIKSG